MTIKKATSEVQRRRRPKRSLTADRESPETPEKNQYYSKNIGRALDVLECFVDDQSNLSLKEISRLIAMPEPSLFRVLLTLESRGYLMRNADGSYRLAPRILFGKLVERAEFLRDTLHPELQKLVSRFNETASLAFLFKDRIQVLDSVETFYEIRITNKIGRILPPHCSAMGKAITAFQERPLIDQILEVYGLDRRTPHTIVDRYALLAEFEQIRTCGYSVDREESMLGGTCIGAAIAPRGSRVVAAISLSTPLVRMPAGREEEIVNGVKDAARDMAEAVRRAEQRRSAEPAVSASAG